MDSKVLFPSVPLRTSKPSILHRTFSKLKRKFHSPISSKDVADLPCEEIGTLSPEIFASYSGPDDGLAVLRPKNQDPNDGTEKVKCYDTVAGVCSWNVKHHRAYGIACSLYDCNPITKRMVGDPFADVYAVCARHNNSILIIADGVNWGRKARLAARCAVRGCMAYLNKHLFPVSASPSNTMEIFDIMLKSFEAAQKLIVQQEGAMTTLCATVVCPLKSSSKFVTCTVNVGDSFAYCFSRSKGVVELTEGSRDVHDDRDLRDVGGALGTVNGAEPDLSNLTCSVMFVDPGDIIFLVTDGISDNFDPVVSRVARRQVSDEEEALVDADLRNVPALTPHERHMCSLKHIEEVVLRAESPSADERVSAQEVCAMVSQHVLRLTAKKREVLEDPELYRDKSEMTNDDKRVWEKEIGAKVARTPGKLDHASIVAFEVGAFEPSRHSVKEKY